MPRIEARTSPVRALAVLVALVAVSCGPVQGWCAETSEAKATINFRTPVRTYRRTPQALDIYVEESLAKGDAALSNKATLKLARALEEIFSTLPAPAAAELRKLRFYLMWGPAAPGGGRDSGMSYIRKGESAHWPLLDPQWEHGIVVYSAGNLIYLDAVWTKKALMHELAHAWHIMHWPEKHPPIFDTYRSARAAGLYANVKDYKGRVIPKAYAVTNQLEYFAELSAIYFVGGNYFPFDRDELYAYDRGGTYMVQQLWGL